MELTRWTDSPYVGICIRPRATIRAIINHDARERVIALVVIAATVGAVSNAIHSYSYNPTAFTIAGRPIPVVAPQTSHLIQLWGLAVWPLLAVPLLYINGALLRWAGSLLGGTAKAVEVRAALAWASVPAIAVTLAGFTIGYLTPHPQPSSLQSMNAMREYWRAMLPAMILSTPLWLWWWIVLLKCLGEVHRFSAWRALGSLLIAYLVLGGALVVAFLVLGTVQAVAWQLTSDPLKRALGLFIAVVTPMGLVAGGWFWRYSRSHVQS